MLAQGRVGEALPANIGEGRFEAIISFLCPWVLPHQLLARSDLAINFHPGSHAYPGSGCYSFALYEGAEEYGAVCHHMEAAVDAGPIICQRLFEVSARDSVETLKFRTMVTLLAMFHDLAWLVAKGCELPRENLTWTRPAFTLKDLDKLRRIDANMSAEEIARRVRAVTYPGYAGAQIEVDLTPPAPILMST